MSFWKIYKYNNADKLLFCFVFYSERFCSSSCPFEKERDFVNEAAAPIQMKRAQVRLRLSMSRYMPGAHGPAWHAQRQLRGRAGQSTRSVAPVIVFSPIHTQRIIILRRQEFGTVSVTTQMEQTPDERKTTRQLNTMLGGYPKNLDDSPNTRERQREFLTRSNIKWERRETVIPSADCTSSQKSESVYTCPRVPFYREMKGLLHTQNTLELREYS
jgi:hypothetical protein